MSKTKCTVKHTTGFKKDYKRAIKRGLKRIVGGSRDAAGDGRNSAREKSRS